MITFQGETPPTAQQIALGQDSTGSPAIFSAEDALLATVPGSCVFTGLNEFNLYTVHMAALQTSNSTYSVVRSIDFSTAEQVGGSSALYLSSPFVR